MRELYALFGIPVVSCFSHCMIDSSIQFDFLIVAFHGIATNPRKIMPRPKTQCETLTIGQLAKRWGIGRDHVRKLTDLRVIPGTFTIPAAGRYGEAVRIPLSSVLLAEQDWAKSPQDYRSANPLQRRQRNGHSPKLKHFPELLNESEDDVESPEDAQH
jgi:hypothetical protein